MLETVGKKLTKTRKSKDLTIEDVEHATHIPHNRLRELEDDDYSHFANLTYAKSFLKLYSDYLEVDTTDYRHELSLYEVDDFGNDPLAVAFEDEAPSRRPAIFAGVMVLLLASLIGAYFFSEYYRKGKEGGDGVGENPALATGGDPGEGEGEGDLKPGAKPPGGLPETPGGKPEIIIRRPVPNPGGTSDTGGGETPILPAEVVGDEEKPLKAIPVDGGSD